MSDTWLLYLASFAVAFSISLLTTPMAKRLGIKFHAVDYPRARGMNKEPVPLMGGLAIVSGFMGSMILMSIFLEDLHTIDSLLALLLVLLLLFLLVCLMIFMN